MRRHRLPSIAAAPVACAVALGACIHPDLAAGVLTPDTASGIPGFYVGHLTAGESVGYPTWSSRRRSPGRYSGQPTIGATRSAGSTTTS
jgi:hypothetical protein